MKAIISGGGTGGHIFPAIAIANAVKEIDKDSEILFVGAKGKMEMDKIPEAGYNIIGLPIRGIQRKISLQNIKVPFLLIQSLWISYKTIKKFKPDVVVGVGGYASAAIVYIASLMKISTLIQEQNSYPGITNKILSKRVDLICVAFEGMDAFFPKEKIKLIGNPVRQDILNKSIDKKQAIEFFHLDPDKKTVLAIGGSLGAQTLNQCMLKLKGELKQLDAQIIWQCGKTYYQKLKTQIDDSEDKLIKLHPFISRMDLAYAASDIVISRAGALSISEIAVLKKPSILIPSPNVAEDHQTKNALALTNQKAAVFLSDKDASQNIIATVKSLLKDQGQIEDLKRNLEKVFSNRNASTDIANELIDLSRKK